MEKSIVNGKNQPFEWSRRPENALENGKNKLN